MRRIAMSAATLALCAGAAFADRIDLSQMTSIGHGMQSGSRAGTIVTGFEAADGYAPGNINGQNSWAGLGTAFAGLGNGAEVQTVLPFAGTQHYASVRDPASGAGNFNGAWHDAGGAGLTTTSAKVYISTAAYADYFFAGIANTGSFAWEVHFSFTGNVRANNSGTNLTPIIYNQYVDLTTTYTQATNVFTISYNGVNIFTGSGFAGNIAYDKFFFGSDNFNTLGGDPNERGLIDNLNAVPAPGAAGLLGLGGLVACRRRRR